MLLNYRVILNLQIVAWRVSNTVRGNKTPTRKELDHDEKQSRVITTAEHKVSLYLHWNGDRGSVEELLECCNLRGFCSPSNDSYSCARLTQVIANFMEAEGLSVRIDAYTDDTHEDPSDNGIYIIYDWQIVKRIGYHGEQRSLLNLYVTLTRRI